MQTSLNANVRKELSALTGLRFLAALAVFIFHIQLRIGTPYLKFRLDNIASQGALGVNLFFVLSGFILAYSHFNDILKYPLDKASYYKKFMVKRIARIYPAYLAGLGIFLLFTMLLANYPVNFTIALLLDTSMLQSFFPPVAMSWYGGGAWSVSVEFFFYLLFPALFFVFLKIKSKKTLLILLTVFIVTASLPGVIHNISPKAVPFSWIYPFAPARLNEFLCGIILAILMYRFDFSVKNSHVYVINFAFLIYLMLFGVAFSGYTVHNFIALPSILGLILICAKEEKSMFVKFLGCRPMKFLGKISYCFYIAQLPLMMALDYAVSNKKIGPEDQYVAVVILLVNLILAVVIHYLVEAPFHRLILAKYGRKLLPINSSVLTK